MKRNTGNRVYHTALKSKFKTFNGVDPLERYEHAGSVAIRHDFVSDGIPGEMELCEVLYSECPWPHGLNRFDDRAGVARRDYATFSDAVFSLITKSQSPVVLVLGKTLLRRLPEPYSVGPCRLNGDRAMVASWGVELPSLSSSNEIARWLGSKYESVGDFCCGYGGPLFDFIAGGGSRFVASDYNAKCIRVMSMRMMEFFK